MTGDHSKFTHNAASMAILAENENRERALSTSSLAGTCRSMSDADVGTRDCHTNRGATTSNVDIFRETDTSDGEVAASYSPARSARSSRMLGEHLGEYDDDYDWESAQRH